jgi:hypothetical protein
LPLDPPERPDDPRPPAGLANDPGRPQAGQFVRGEAGFTEYDVGVLAERRRAGAPSARRLFEADRCVDRAKAPSSRMLFLHDDPARADLGVALELGVAVDRGARTSQASNALIQSATVRSRKTGARMFISAARCLARPARDAKRGSRARSPRPTAAQKGSQSIGRIKA